MELLLEEIYDFDRTNLNENQIGSAYSCDH
jgi:hypothetical protein